RWGARLRYDLDCAVVTGQVQLALGTTREEVTIAGSQLRVRPDGSTTVSQGALLALPGNIGRFHRNVFTQVPELSWNVAVPVNDHLTLSTGFSALYWTRIARPGDEVATAIDVTQIPNFP